MHMSVCVCVTRGVLLFFLTPLRLAGMKAFRQSTASGLCSGDATVCHSCARSFEGNSLSISCGAEEGKPYVVGDIVDAAWGVADEQPEWQYFPNPGRCVVEEPIDPGRMKRADRAKVIRRLKTACLGQGLCKLTATRTLLGKVPQVPQERLLAISVQAKCMHEDDYAEVCICVKCTGVYV